MNRASAYELGWIGIRASAVGKSSRKLRAEGWIKVGHAELNNRGGFDWLRPVRTREQFEQTDWTPLARAGLVGIAMWFTDTQWKHGLGVTDKQWVARAIIELDFNKKWPTGRRP